MTNPPIIGQQPAPKININLNDYPVQYCKNCGGEIFIQGHLVKVIPALHVGAASDQILKQEVMLCMQCGEALKADPTLKKGDKKKIALHPVDTGNRKAVRNKRKKGRR